MCSAFTANEYSWFEHRSNAVVTMETVGISNRTAFLMDELAKYDVSAG